MGHEQRFPHFVLTGRFRLRKAVALLPAYRLRRIWVAFKPWLASCCRKKTMYPPHGSPWLGASPPCPNSVDGGGAHAARPPMTTLC
jgi:hypothetical protein